MGLLGRHLGQRIDALDVAAVVLVRIGAERLDGLAERARHLAGEEKTVLTKIMLLATHVKLKKQLIEKEEKTVAIIVAVVEIKCLIAPDAT